MKIDNANQETLAELESQYEALKQDGLDLDLTRGKPNAEQVALADALDGILDGDYRAADGSDVRNYGGLNGLPEARALFGEVLGAPAANTLIGGNASLSLMYLTVDLALNFGLAGPASAWKQSDKVKILCPVPGYDRHFSICEHLGIDMIPVALNDDGPDMADIEARVASDPSIKGIWCVPRFSNPTGCTYSDELVARIAALGNIAGDHFLVLWDNAYAVHTLTDDAPALANIHAQCEAAGTLDNLVQFGSTSKVTFAGAGVSFLASSEANLKAISEHLSFQTIGPDKVNQLRHVRFLEDLAGIETHMARHAALIRPRFDAVLDILDEELADGGMGEWTRPEGGYFISFNSQPGLAGEIVRLAAMLGVKLTPAGATFPYGRDPHDRNIRLAPTFPSLDDVRAATRVFTLCVKLASVRRQLDQA